MKVICRVPVRINLANGGDTDYYLKEIGWGCVVNATLSSHFYEIELNENKDFKLDVLDYFDYAENMNRSYKLGSDFSEIDLLKACLKEVNFEGKNSYVLRTNVPMQSGLGGSSSVAVAILGAIMHYRKEYLSPDKIAYLAYSLERNGLKTLGGYQDQYAAAFGKGFNYMEFEPSTSADKIIRGISNPKVNVENLSLKEETLKKLEKNLVLYYLSKRKVSGTDMHKAQHENIKKDPELVKNILIEKRENAVKIKAALLKGNLDEFGRLLKIDGELKNKLSNNIPNDFTGSIMKMALNNGALGGKISGAGSGGCMLFYVPDENLDRFKRVMSSTGALEMNFRFQRPNEEGILIKIIN